MDLTHLHTVIICLSCYELLFLADQLHLGFFLICLKLQYLVEAFLKI